MKTAKTVLLRRLMIVLFGLCFIISGAMMAMTFGSASADGLEIGTFQMDDGAYVKVNGDYGGLRLRVKMDETTKAVADADGNSMFFLLMDRTTFDAAKDGEEYDFSGYLPDLDSKKFTTDGYAKQSIAKNSVYKGLNEDYYYANLLIKDISENYLVTDFCVVAAITNGTLTEFATFEDETQVCKKYYTTLNNAALDEFMDKIFAITDYSWYGTTSYPVYAETNEQYSNLKNSVSEQGVSLSGKYIDIADGVTRDDSFESSNGSYAETVDVNFDFDLTLNTAYSVNTADIDGDLTAAAVNSVALANGTPISFTAEDNELDLANADIKALVTGEKFLRVATDDKMYKVGVIGVTEILTTWARFKEVTKKSDTTDYYILGDDITAGEVYAQTRVTFGGSVDRDQANFRGVLDGRGHIVRDMKISKNNGYSSSLIYNLYGTVKNIAFVNASIDSWNKSYNGGSGALCCSLVGTIENVYMEVTLKNSDAGYACGLCNSSTNDNANIKNCIVKATIADGSTGNCYGFSQVSNTHIDNSYLISGDIARFNSTYGNGSYTTCAKYDTIADFFTEVTSLSSENGWADCFSIADDTLTINGHTLITNSSTPDITDLFTFSTGGIIVNSQAGTPSTANSGASNFVCSGYVDISDYQGKFLSITMLKSPNYGLYFYDTNKTAISGVKKNDDDSAGKVYDILIPENACYVRTTYYNPSGAYASALEGHPFSAKIKLVSDITELFNFSTGGIVVNSQAGTPGNAKADAKNFVYSGYVDISDYQGIILSITMLKSPNYGLYFYDTNKTAISGVNKDDDDSAGKVYDISIPQNACYVRTTYYNPSGAYASALDGHPFSAQIKDAD